MAGRPENLFGYFRDVDSLRGIGPRLAAALERLCGRRVRDLLFHAPSQVIDRSAVPKIADVLTGMRATIAVEVREHVPAANRRSPYKVIVGDDSGTMTLVFFHGRGDWLKKQLPVGEQRYVCGEVEDFQGQWQMAHPDYILRPDALEDLPRIEPVYPLTEGVSNKVIRKAVMQALSTVPALDDWQDTGARDAAGWPSFNAALAALHAPESGMDLSPLSPVRARLAYDEILADQLAIALVRNRERARKGRAVTSDGSLTARAQAALPYQLTGDQQAALDAVVADMRSDKAMLRLLQGDVGSGKTVVAFLAALHSIEAGHQAALLAPTEILAQQHFMTLRALGESVGISVALLTGRIKGKARAELLAALAAGDIDLLIGTHAIIQDAVVYHDLALAIIDEQHRFGVAQRLALARKGAAGVDVLGMTATPIPRTLTLALFGDMDVSRIAEKPPGRKPITTRVVARERLDAVVDSLRRAFAQGAQAYWVTPLIAESASTDMAAAEERFAHLQQHFGDKVGLLHGQMLARDKDAVMARFAEGALNLLVATTVIEVGVDVPAASIMIIEGAERFGLAQLHQLRGRVGRGDQDSSCLLIRGDHLSDVAKERLKVIRDSEDGFFLAEEDLRLRGAGEILGKRQSGLPSMLFADYAVHGELLARARKEARYLVEMDALNTGARGAALRTLLYLFERDTGIRLMQSG